MIAYKWVRKNLTTYNGFQLEIGLWETTSGEGGLCGPGWLHAFRTPLLAVLHKPVCDLRNYDDLYEVEIDGEIKDEDFKLGATRIRLIRQIEPPVLTTDQIVEYAIRVIQKAMQITCISIPVWFEWATRWLDGSDRSKNAAWAAEAAVNATTVAADVAIVYAVSATTRAVEDAVEAATADGVATHAARAAAGAARAVGAVGTRIDLATIAEQVCNA
jgi:hypothetical protein